MSSRRLMAASSSTASLSGGQCLKLACASACALPVCGAAVGGLWRLRFKAVALDVLLYQRDPLEVRDLSRVLVRHVLGQERVDVLHQAVVEDALAARVVVAQM